MKLRATLAAAALLLTAAPAMAMQPPAAPAAAVSDADVTKFAKLMVQMKEQEKAGKAVDNEFLLKAVETLGLSIDSYNAISGGMRTDTALNDRVNAAFQVEARAAQASATPAATAGAPSGGTQ